MTSLISEFVLKASYFPFSFSQLKALTALSMLLQEKSAKESILIVPQWVCCLHIILLVCLWIVCISSFTFYTKNI